MLKHIVTVAALMLPLAAQAQQTDRMHSSGMPHVEHGAGMAQAESVSVREPGQGAFAAIQEIVALLESDAETDWTKVNIDGLREHLIDMDNVTMRAEVTTTNVEGGKRYLVTGAGTIEDSIDRMIKGHAETMDGVDGISISAVSLPNGTAMTVTVADPGGLAKLDGLGFIGVMALGTHHQDHHLMVAKGEDPHG
ncbi:MAG: hypothetical protein HOK98_01570 [Rhodospirillaceae bacterium]|jgi:phosphotransferase system HPr-like phosphotransfer protein|nr:hypothetical protein [Rhodospirillaceae bacterium]MBT5943488.1 hypothetical protein [Rhodospirillaceae bacterium]MBT6404954.1 hypothetical protein [Rhodospirillaceae bacterium]MBT6534845.1 hypothetical protein [Rhodospirillaceae bacterium]MBT7363040.1 hypothetical protein [Rhodospirillaceae bacterium]